MFILTLYPSFNPKRLLIAKRTITVNKITMVDTARLKQSYVGIIKPIKRLTNTRTTPANMILFFMTSLLHWG